MTHKVGDWVKIGPDRKDDGMCLGLSGYDGKFGRIKNISQNAHFYVRIDNTVWGCFSASQMIPCCEHGRVEGEECMPCNASVAQPKFKVGDRVKYTTGRYGWDRDTNPKDVVGAVVGYGGLGILVKWPSGARNSYISEDLQKIEEPEPTRVFNFITYDELGDFDYTKTATYLTHQHLFKERKTLMRRLSELAQSIRRTFSADQKALWRTGRIDDAGKWTTKAKDEAYEEMVSAYLKEHEAQMVEAANEEIELAKEEKAECE